MCFPVWIRLEVAIYNGKGVSCTVDPFLFLYIFFIFLVVENVGYDMMELIFVGLDLDHGILWESFHFNVMFLFRDNIYIYIYIYLYRSNIAY
jgi:hypothetical protein